MDGQGVKSIVETAERAAGIHEPKVIEGPGFKKLALETLTTAEAGAWQRTYDLQDLPCADPRPAALKVHTLTGLVDYIRANRDGLNLDDCLVQVVDHTKVQLISKTSGTFHQRSVHAEATYQELTPGGDPPFRYGQFTKAEDFNIALQALFDDRADRAKVLEVIGNAKRVSSVAISDNGISQAVFAESGVALGKDIEVPNPVFLAPWRTFREIEQPASRFVLRARGDEMPTYALFEADGGAWKLEAIDCIKVFFQANLKATLDTTTMDGKGGAIETNKLLVAIVA